MIITYNTPFEVTPAQYKAILADYDWACAHRKDDAGQHYIKVMIIDKKVFTEIIWLLMAPNQQ